ncbi:cytokine receptor family member b1 isoform X2 [Hippocampus zosterae]|nr:cytokine receptor family member b1 isoform X2 [Hippocampus zosterae]
MTTATSLQLKLDKYKYYFTVQAFYNGTWSPESEEVSFSPFEQTLIGPPKVTVTECGNCIQINISLPEADKSSGIPNNDIMAIYKAKFRVLWKKSNKTEEVYKTQARSVKINNLEKGKQYCVQIQTEITMNKNTEPSTWVCTTTSIAELDRVPVLGITLGLLICCIGTLMTLTYCLYYTGFLCKLQATLPRALITVLMHAKSLPVEETSPDLISVCSDTFKQKYPIITSLCPTPRITCSDEEVGEEEDENEGSNFYINRDGEKLSRESSCHDSCNVLRTSLTAKSRAEADISDISSETVPAKRDQLKTGVEKDTFLSRWPEMEVKEQLIFELEEEMDEKTINMSENVNLSSVTLTATAIHEKGQVNSEDAHADSLRLSEWEPLMLAATKQSLLHTDMPTDSDDLTSTECTCFGETNYERGCDDLETQDKLREEQFLGYMGR